MRNATKQLLSTAGKLTAISLAVSAALAAMVPAGPQARVVQTITSNLTLTARYEQQAAPRYVSQTGSVRLRQLF